MHKAPFPSLNHFKCLSIMKVILLWGAGLQSNSLLSKLWSSSTGSQWTRLSNSTCIRKSWWEYSQLFWNMGNFFGLSYLRKAAWSAVTGSCEQAMSRITLLQCKSIADLCQTWEDVDSPIGAWQSTQKALFNQKKKKNGWTLKPLFKPVHLLWKVKPCWWSASPHIHIIAQCFILSDCLMKWF